MRLTHIAPSSKLALFPAARRSSRAPLPISQAGPDLAVHADHPAHAVPPLDNTAAAVEFLLQRPARGGNGQHADMAGFAANGRQRWADLVGRLLPSATPDQQRLRAAMMAVDRRYFVEPSTPEALVYEDCPLPIGYGQTLSAPHMWSTCLELLEPKLQPGARVLDVGSGSGYLTAVFGRLVGPRGSVLGVEKMEPLARRSSQSIQSCQPHLLNDGTVRIVVGNALGEALRDEHEPFDAIHVGAAAASMPDTLLSKLAPGGRMVIPVGGQDEFQTLQVLDKDQNGKATATPLMAVRYVPLTSPEQ